jgi:hypothetical protein
MNMVRAARQRASDALFHGTSRRDAPVTYFSVGLASAHELRNTPEKALHDRLIGTFFSKARCKYEREFAADGQALNDNVRLYAKIGSALIASKAAQTDPFAAIEAVIPWEQFTASVAQAEKLSRDEAFDPLALLSDYFSTLRKYAPAFLEAFQFRGAPVAKFLLDAIDLLRAMNQASARKVPADAPLAFVPPRWARSVGAGGDIDRRLLYHESQLRIEEHYTDTAGFTDQVFALCHMLGFEFAPRIADLADKRIYVPGKPGDWPNLVPLIGGPLNLKLMEQQFDEVMRLTASIKQGTVTASLILRKLSAYPRQNSLAMGLREYGRLERTLFTLKWLRDPALRRRVTGGLNKGEARNALARTVFFHRLGEIRDRSYENQRYRASGLNLVIAAITLWNTVYLERAVTALRERGAVNDTLLGHIAPLGWNHIGLTGDYNWHANKRVAKGGFRPLRRVRPVESVVAAP